MAQCVVAFLILLNLHQNYIACDNSAEELWHFLFNNNSYNKNLRPVMNSSTQMEIDLRLNVVAIVDFSEVEETMTLTAFLPLCWTDEFLRWDPTLFGNLTHLSVPQEVVWKPYINLENSVVKLGELGTPSLQVYIEHTGNVVWKPIEVFTVSCPADVYKFPFDTQICYMIFEPSGYRMDEVILTSSVETVDFREYEGTSGWTIASSKIEAKIKHTDSYAICSLTLKRKPLYFLLNIFLPIMLLSILNMFVFILPVESGEKASFVVTVFLALAVFLTIVSGKLPENSQKISLLNVYVFESTLLSTLIAIVTIILICLHNRDPRCHVPLWLQKLVQRLLPGSRGRRIAVLDATSQEENHYSATREKESNVPVKDIRDTKADNDRGEDMSWPDVVRALDKVFFGVFLTGYFIITVSLLGIAIND